MDDAVSEKTVQHLAAKARAWNEEEVWAAVVDPADLAHWTSFADTYLDLAKARQMGMTKSHAAYMDYYAKKLFGNAAEEPSWAKKIDHWFEEAKAAEKAGATYDEEQGMYPDDYPFHTFPKDPVWPKFTGLGGLYDANKRDVPVDEVPRVRIEVENAALRAKVDLLERAVKAECKAEENSAWADYSMTRSDLTEQENKELRAKVDDLKEKILALRMKSMEEHQNTVDAYGQRARAFDSEVEARSSARAAKALVWLLTPLAGAGAGWIAVEISRLFF